MHISAFASNSTWIVFCVITANPFPPSRHMLSHDAMLFSFSKQNLKDLWVESLFYQWFHAFCGFQRLLCYSLRVWIKARLRLHDINISTNKLSFICVRIYKTCHQHFSLFSLQLDKTIQTISLCQVMNWGNASITELWCERMHRICLWLSQ